MAKDLEEQTQGPSRITYTGQPLATVDPLSLSLGGWSARILH